MLSVVALIALRSLYAGVLEGLGASSGGLVWGIGVAVVLALIVISVNIVAVRRKIKSAWSLRINDAG